MHSTLFLSLPSFPNTKPSSHVLVLSFSLNPKNPQKHDHAIKIPEFSVLPTPIDTRKSPTPPWMRTPILIQPHEPDSQIKKKKRLKTRDIEKSEKSLSGKVSSVKGNKAVQSIVKRIERLGSEKDEKFESFEENFGNVEFGSCFEEIKGDEGVSGFRGELPWERERDENAVFRRMKKEKVLSGAELSLDEELLGRLRERARKLRKWVKVKKIGVSDAVVDEIKGIWRRHELVMVKFDVPLCRNMDRAQEILEMKTGGLVVWRKKDTLVIYRGISYHSNTKAKMIRAFSKVTLEAPNPNLNEMLMSRNTQLVEPCVSMKEKASFSPVMGTLYERETDRLLEGLGPRFVDWWMQKPLPVDADLLPEVVPGYRSPQRFCPPNDRSKLRDDELTYLRNFAQSLPTHFVLGRNRKLQGLAAAILKLWEKSLIAKIAVKWGVPNTDNAQMAYELKLLTGGVLLLRNKFYIILFRGKDFLPRGLADSVTEREMELRRLQASEEDARLKALETFPLAPVPMPLTSTAGTLSEFLNAQEEFTDVEKGVKEVNIQLEAKKEAPMKELRNQERRLFILKSKVEKSGKQLSKLNSGCKPTEQDADQEMMTEEERECFKKMGLKMHDRLMLGRRGVFDGVVEALHQHWKHREVVKVITMQRTFEQVINTANMLEVASGGVLVSIDKQKEGHAIIIYRGKNYRRPPKLATGHLLTKRKALLRSLEKQRLGSLKYFAYKTEQAISDLRGQLAELENEL